jgi:hypothetical protein
MDLYPWRFDSIHSHSYDDGIIFYSILKEFGLSRTSATRSEEVSSVGNPPGGGILGKAAIKAKEIETILHKSLLYQHKTKP